MKHYLMEDIDGEQFLVGADYEDEAIVIAQDYAFEQPMVLRILTDWEAEATGLDEF